MNYNKILQQKKDWGGGGGGVVDVLLAKDTAIFIEKSIAVFQ